MSYLMTIIYSIPIALLFGFGFFHFKKRGYSFAAGMSGLCGLLTVPAAMFYALTPFERVIGIFLSVSFVIARVLSKNGH
jgi:hypothetical protein